MVLPPTSLRSHLRVLFCCYDVFSEEFFQCCRMGIGLIITTLLTASCSVLCTHFHYTVYTQQFDTCKRNQKVRLLLCTKAVQAVGACATIKLA